MTNVWSCVRDICTGSSICDDMHSKSGVDNNSASMGTAVCNMEKGA